VNFVQNAAGYGAFICGDIFWTVISFARITVSVNWVTLSVNGVGVGGLNNYRKVFADMSLVSLRVRLVEIIYGYEIGAFGGACYGEIGSVVGDGDFLESGTCSRPCRVGPFAGRANGILCGAFVWGMAVGTLSTDLLVLASRLFMAKLEAFGALNWSWCW
jgi:hypothetical protein